MKLIYITTSITLLSLFYKSANAQCLGSNLVCINTTEQYEYTGPSTKIYWSVTGGGTVNGDARGRIITVTWDTGGVHRLLLEDQLDGNDCWIDVTVKTAVGGTVTADSPVVCEDGGTTLRLSGESGSVVRWESSGNAVSWTPITQTSKTYYISNLTSSLYYRAVVTNCSLTDFSASAYVELSTGGTVSVTGGSTQYCSGESTNVTLRINNYSGVLKAWQQSVYSSGAWGSWQTVTSNPPDEFQFSFSQPTRFRGYVLTDDCSFLPSKNYIEVSETPGTLEGYLVSTHTSVCTGEPFSISVEGERGDVVQWFVRDDDHDWGNLSSPSNITITRTSYFKAWVKNGSCSTRETAAISVQHKPVPQINSGTATICSGGQVNFTPSSTVEGTNYSWTASFTSSISGVPLNGTTVPLNHTIGNTSNTSQLVTYTITPSKDGCTGTPKDYSVTVNPLPTVSVAPASQTICSEGQTNLTVSNPNSVSGTTFNWTVTAPNWITGESSGSGSLIQQTLTNTSTVDGAAVYVATASANGCSSPASATATVVVKPKPTTSNAGSDQTGFATCGLTSVTLAGKAPAIGSGLWSIVSGSGGYFDSNVQNTTSSNRTAPFSGTPGINYILKWTISNAPCTASTDEVNIRLNVNPTATPTVTGNSRFGTGTLTLNASGASGGENYAWFTSSGSALPTGAQYITPELSSSITNYCYVKLTNTNSCLGPPRWVDINIYPVPVITSNAGRVYKGSQATLATSPYDSYTWRNGAGTVVGSTQTYIASQPDSYTVSVTKGVLTATSEVFLLPGQFDGQDENYIIAHTMQAEGITTQQGLDQYPVESVAQAVQYFDGLGRPMQSVSTQASPGKLDIVQPVVYDDFGREKKKYLPFTAEEDGWYKPTEDIIDPSTGAFIGIAQLFYSTTTDKIADDPVPFAETVFEPSPLNRIAEQGAPGSTWQPGTSHTITKNNEVNTADEVYLFQYDAATGLLSNSGYYGVNQLYKNVTVDEKQNEVIEYIDKEGRTVCKKVQYASGPYDSKFYASTYYIYDDFGNLVLVLPPEAIRNIEQN